MKTSNKEEFWKNFLCRDSIKSPFNFHKFCLCIPISLGAQVQTYVNKNQIFEKPTKEKCNLNEMSCIILIESVFFDIACYVSSRCVLLLSKVVEQCFPCWRKVLPINGASTLAKLWWLLMPPFQSGSCVILFQPRVRALKIWQCGYYSKNLATWSVPNLWCMPIGEASMMCATRRIFNDSVSILPCRKSSIVSAREKSPPSRMCCVLFPKTKPFSWLLCAAGSCLKNLPSKNILNLLLTNLPKSFNLNRISHSLFHFNILPCSEWQAEYPSKNSTNCDSECLLYGKYATLSFDSVLTLLLYATCFHFYMAACREFMEE